MLRKLAIRSLEAVNRLRAGLSAKDNRLLVLIYHRVLPRPDPMYPYDPDVASFRMHMQALSEDFNVLRLDEAIDTSGAGRSAPARRCHHLRRWICGQRHPGVAHSGGPGIDGDVLHRLRIPRRGLHVQ